MLWQGKTYKNPFEVSSEDVLELLSLWKNKETVVKVTKGSQV